MTLIVPEPQNSELEAEIVKLMTHKIAMTDPEIADRMRLIVSLAFNFGFIAGVENARDTLTGDKQ